MAPKLIAVVAVDFRKSRLARFIFWQETSITFLRK